MTQWIRRIALLGAACLLIVACTGRPSADTETPQAAAAPTDTAEPTDTAAPPTSTAPPPTAAPQLVANLDEAAGFHPYLVGQNPPAGAEWSIDEPLELYFDQPMNRETTAAAFTLTDAENVPIEGELEWVQPRILRFKPAEPLAVGADYQVTLFDTATSEAGIGLSEAITFNIQTTGALEITQVTPLPGAIETATDNAITVIFNRPVVPLTVSTETGDFPEPLIFNPPVEGVGEWVNTSVYIFRPTVPLNSSTNYTVQVSAEAINSYDGSSLVLPNDFVWNFATQSATINALGLPGFDEFISYSAYTNVPRRQPVRVYFNQEMNRGSTEAAVTLVNSNGGTVPLDYGWNEIGNTLTVTPTQLLDYGTEYTFRMRNTAESATGGTLLEGRTLPLTTVDLPAISGTFPENGSISTTFNGSFTINFESPMDPESLTDKLVIEPPLELEPELYYDNWGWSVTYFGFKPSTDYVIRILPGMADPYGTEITEERVVSFRTGPYDPVAALRIPGRFALYREGGTTDIWVQYQNVNQLDIGLFPISAREFFNQGAFFSRPLDFNVNTREPIWAQTTLPEYSDNTRELIRYDLVDENGGPLPLGFYFITLNSPDVPKFGDQRHNDARPVLLANANVTMKLTSSEALIWVTDLETGAPVPGADITLFNDSGSPLVTGRTDSEGLFYADSLNLNIRDDYYSVVQGENVFGFGSSDETRGVRPNDFGIYIDRYSDPVEASIYTYTDRPLYRSGDTVHFKGIIRTEDDLVYEIPGFPTVDVTIGNYEGDVYNETLTVNEFGTFEGTVELDPEATLGFYDIRVSAPRLGTRYAGSFDVAEFRKPTFQVEVSGEPADILASDPIAAEVEADFFSGGAVANADVFWYLTEAATTFNPPGREYDSYSFNNLDFDRYFYYDPFYNPFGETIADGSGMTDGFGLFRYEQPAQTIPADESGETRLLTFEATVVDLAGNGVTGRSNIIVHPSTLYGGIKPATRLNPVGEPLGLDVVVLDWDANPQPNHPVTIEVYKRDWFSYQEVDEDTGRTIWRSTVEETLVETIEGLVTDSEGKVTGEFVPPEGGTYRAYAVVEDDQGNVSRTSTYLWIYGGSYVNWGRSSDHTFDLILNKSDFEPGETAELLIASPFQGEAYALVTVERGHIYQREVVKLESNSTVFRLPIEGWMAPNAFASVLIMKGVDETNPVPDFKYGIVEFDVARTEQELNIAITADDTQLGPQDTVTFDLVVTDYTGAPVEAELSLSLVDLALLSLQNQAQPPILDFFYNRGTLSVVTSLLLTAEMDSVNQEIREVAKGGGGGGGFFDALSFVDVREDFKDSAYWSAQVQTDANGRAQVSIQLPDNLTTWRLDARAITIDTKVGSATSDIQTTLPLLINPQTPRFFIRGDQSTVGALVRNTTNSPIDVEVSLEIEGATLAAGDSAVQTVNIPANDSAYVPWSILVQDVERVDLAFLAEGGGFADATRPTQGSLEGNGIPVYKYESPETVGSSGQLLDGGIIVESIALPIYPDNDYVPTEGEVTVQVAPSLAAAMTDGLDYLTHYPYECTEQVVSRFLPNVLTVQAMEAAGIQDPVLKANLDFEVGIALQKLYARQLPSGGFPWWDGNRASDLVTAYAVLGLYEAQEAGYDVDPVALKNGINYLVNNIENTVTDDSPRYTLNRQAFITHVLTRVGQPPLNVISTLHDNRADMDLYARAYVAQSIYLANPNDPRLDTYLSDFVGSAVTSASGTNWEDGVDVWNWNTSTRTTAIVLSAMVQLDPESPLVANAVRWLMAHRTNGRWKTTQETAWTLMSLTDFMVATGELDADYQYEVALNGELLLEGAGSAETLRTPEEINLAITELFTDQINQLAFGRTNGPGNLYYTAHMTINLPVEELDPLDNGFIIQRQYFRPDDLETPVDTAEQGETLVARLTIITPGTRHYVSIDDWLPAGLEAIDTSLLTSPNAGVPDPFELSRGGFGSSGWGWWYFDHVQLRDEKVEIAASYLPAGTYEYNYLVRVATPGVYKTIPPIATTFYFPEVYGRGEGMLFTVTAPE